MSHKPSFIEVGSVEEANTVDMNYYTFCERLSATRGKYVFKIREAKR
jgi:hypothetical protein